MVKLKLGNALVLGEKNLKANEVKRILVEHFQIVKMIPRLPDKDEFYPEDYFKLIVFTDTSETKPDRDIVVNLRKLFPRAKVLGLFDNMDDEIEMSMRSAGLVFLGSHDHFNKHSSQIIFSAFKSEGMMKNLRRSKKPDTKKESL